MPTFSSEIVQLGQYKVAKGHSSVSGLSSGAFMTVQLHLAHSASFIGAGVVAGGPYRGVETFRGSAALAEDAFELNALQLCMAPLTPDLAPDARRSVMLAREAERDRLIDPLSHVARQRVYIFTGSRDNVVQSSVVAQAREMYRLLGVADERIAYHDQLPAGHSLITDNPEDSPLDTNMPPYLNNGGFMQSHRILKHIYPDLNPPAERLSGQILRFDQTEFFGGNPRTSMSRFGYAYVPQAVADGQAEARVHIALHGCKQGYNYVDYSFGHAETSGQPPYGNRYLTTTGYNNIADSNNIIVLYPQAQGTDDSTAQNPDGCWDWWGYTSETPEHPDYFSQNALQIQAVHAMLRRLGG
ncbi:poly(3-hydroxybutyrate) depolymerase [Chromobacterium sp. IIBBL 290-4]|uniref:extracellular catalytic domain type 2 short-chain-length polyhydroxyalkanoate depolymerase n=1 Tax=Chromobacterium sp. IIBBL 290-4 TaxID=2953890 RepID=UPI0020B76C81|nr:poly(3-hydroxybutyrate) depolymerase [Chromobacterium sp. IIBBL 290-4]UTH73191.1 poly(3-hydroxybutyrate) depolymerase [Chromobacterium sp. IIBBL 290-4]